MDKKIKDLPPAERIKRLKELEEAKKKEIAEAADLIRESEEELTERQKILDKVPIPQVAIQDTTSLSAEEKQILKEHHGLKEKIKPTEPESKKGQKETLEETVTAELPEIPPELAVQYEAPGTGLPALPLKEQPMADLYREMTDLYQQEVERGYLSGEAQRRAMYLASAVEEKLEDVEAGHYSFTEDVAKAAMVTQQMGDKLRDSYREGPGQEDKRSGADWYKK